jgi:hypothetical protein
MVSSTPVDLAIKQLAETRGLLQQLIVSSESFDYPKAKLALEELRRKIVELERFQRKLESERPDHETDPKVTQGVIPFPRMIMRRNV